MDRIRWAISNACKFLLELHHLLDLVQVLGATLSDLGHRIGLRLAGDLGQILHVAQHLFAGFAREFALFAGIAHADAASRDADPDAKTGQTVSASELFGAGSGGE